MRNRGKKYNEVAKKVERNSRYTLEQACGLVSETRPQASSRV